MPVEEQVVVLYTGVNGYLDDLPLEAVKRFERDFLRFMREKHSDILEDIKTKKEITEETEEKLKKAIEEFKKEFRV